MTNIVCPQTRQSRPVVCLPMAYYRDTEMTQKVVICYRCRIEQPGGEAAVAAFYDQLREKS